MIIRQIKKEEKKRVNELFAVAFEQPLENGPMDDEDNNKIHTWAAFEDNDINMISTFSVSDFDISFDGNRCKMGGIGGVATLPQYRRQGGIRGCFEKAIPTMYAQNYDFSYLYPFSTAYYRKFGYENCVQKYHLTIDLGLLNPEKTDGYFTMVEDGTSNVKNIMQIDSVWEKRYNMMVLHSIDDYDWVVKTDPAKTLEFLYIYFDKNDKPLAYTVFRMQNENDGRNLLCSRFSFVNKEGFMGLMGLFKSLSSDHKYVKLVLPSETAMQYLCNEWSMGAALWQILPSGMVRVINVKSVLKKAKYIGDGIVNIQIIDTQIRENNATYRLKFENGRAISVEPTEKEPDIRMPINIFSALISGVSAFDEAKGYMNGIEVLTDNTSIERVFYKKPLMIADYF